jgi:hypothetical protein
MEKTEGGSTGFPSLLTVEKQIQRRAEVHMMGFFEKSFGNLIGIFAIIFAVVVLSAPAMAAVKLPQTGQTTSYAEGDDGDIRAGVAWPSPRFSQGSGAEADCMIDNLTGLMWLKNPSSTARTWQDSLVYVANLNVPGTTPCGHNDWRLPNVNELQGLVNAGAPSTAAWLNSQGFTGVLTTYKYWTSTSIVAMPGYVWTPYLVDGTMSDYPAKTESQLSFPVRGTTIGSSRVLKTGQTSCWNASGDTVTCAGSGQDGETQAGEPWVPSTRFSVDGDCVLDTATGRMWVRAPSSSGRTWQGALDYVATLNVPGTALCGYTDWRLPNIIELRSLDNYGAQYPYVWLNNNGFSGVSDSMTWSSTSTSLNYAFIFGTWLGHVNTTNKADNGPWWAWAVRNAEPDISLSPGALDFGDGVIDHASTIQTITITNNGSIDLVVSTIEVTGTSPTMFDVGPGATNGCAIPNATVIPGGSCTLDVTFTPDIVGPKDALLYVNSNDPDTPRIQVSLSGNGVIALYTPLEGTIGTEITITGSGFGDAKGKVLIGTVAAKVTSWTDTQIICTVKKVPLPVGPFSISVTTKTKETITLPDDFTVKNPELDPLTDDNKSGIPEEEIVLTGKFFGTKKGKVYLEELSSGKKKSCKVTKWYMNPTTGESEIRFIVPKVSKSFTPGPHPLTIDNKIGVAAASENFVVGLP